LEQLAPHLLEATEGAAHSHTNPTRQQGASLARRVSVADGAFSLLDWQTVFGNDHPVEVEVGFGKGLFLIRAATACPEVNFLGVEISCKYQLLTATRLAQHGLANVRLAKADARTLLRERVADASVQAVHVYFPDPWWKQRHRRRRVFTAEFVAECVRVLRPGGFLHVATDVEEYFGVISAMLREQTRLRPLPPPAATEPAHDLDYLTHFERKFRKEGRPVYRASYERL
jgi:tRNA (guanine-N7-)-methyltransferase